MGVGIRCTVEGEYRPPAPVHPPLVVPEGVQITNILLNLQKTFITRGTGKQQTTTTDSKSLLIISPSTILFLVFSYYKITDF